MFGPKVHLFAAAIAFTVGGASGANAGIFGNDGCCAPVAWGCQSTCARMPNIIYGTPQAYYPQPVYPVNQGPVYEPSALPYGEPGYAPEAGIAPYGGYGYPLYGPGFRRFGAPGFRHFGIRGHRPFVRSFRPGFHTAMHPNRFVGHRPMMRGRR